MGEENISKYDVERCVAFDQELASCLYLEFGYCCYKKGNCNRVVRCLADVPHEITVYTGDVKSAGTDSAISLTLFGSEGTTPELVLDKDESRFERGGVDLIRMDLDDVGKLLKARIAVDGKGTRPDWFLEKVSYLF